MKWKKDNPDIIREYQHRAIPTPHVHFLSAPTMAKPIARKINCSDAAHAGVPASRVRVLALRSPKPPCLTAAGGAFVVNCTSRSPDEWARGLSPFFCGPVDLYDGRTARNVENAWQYTKVYPVHARFNVVTDAYWEWAQAGWAAPSAVRYPMGRGAKPLFSLWAGGAKFGYIDARKQIYCPLYAAAVRETPAFARLERMYHNAVVADRPLVLHDYDGWDHVGQGFSLREVINQRSPKMGHAFVLAGLLEGNLFWK